MCTTGPRHCLCVPLDLGTACVYHCARAGLLGLGLAFTTLMWGGGAVERYGVFFMCKIKCLYSFIQKQMLLIPL